MVRDFDGANSSYTETRAAIQMLVNTMRRQDRIQGVGSGRQSSRLSVSVKDLDQPRAASIRTDNKNPSDLLLGLLCGIFTIIVSGKAQLTVATSAGNTLSCTMSPGREARAARRATVTDIPTTRIHKARQS